MTLDCRLERLVRLALLIVVAHVVGAGKRRLPYEAVASIAWIRLGWARSFGKNVWPAVLDIWRFLISIMFRTQLL